jgi:hypothetical protein
MLTFSTNMIEHVITCSDFFYDKAFQIDYMEQSLPEQLTVAHYRVHMNLSLKSILDQFNLVSIFKRYFFNINFNIILSYTTKSPK